eukprot:TRINITY_DN37925_c0_g1_i2.p1 TRINITY_DN37925_c0_g1~~TRINITY_DN37925_c0_g1_i2.p1  ORF type:complete len:912 (+),score=81.72 TRINITY_DN37925_c0_g1_i2:291-2738(+)
MCKRYPQLGVACIEICELSPTALLSVNAANTAAASGGPPTKASIASTSMQQNSKTKGAKCSVLYKWCPEQQKMQRIYRVVLALLEGTMGARNPIIGEGKSENQNHAIIFTRGETIQAIDMNQEMYLEEALKLRNLLQEFAKDSKLGILGFRESAFLPAAITPSYHSNLAQTCFTAFDSRAFHTPMRVRFHYGHPDVLDRTLVQTMGGMSKGSAIINVTEDVYCGMNYTQRGFTVSQVDYIMCSKGWPNDLDQVVAFMRKIACGSAEAQASSRDAFRLAHGMDFFRYLSLFAAFPGWNILNPLVFFAIWLFIYGRLFFHACVELIPGSLEPLITSEESSRISLMDQMWLVLLALFYTRFFAVTALEEGIHRGLFHLWQHLRSLSLLHYTFAVGTWTGGFDETLLFGRAKYQNAGRGFAINHKDFIHLWKSYFYSHFQPAIELSLLLVYLHFLQDMFVVLGVRIWWLWFVVFSFLYLPHIYNPMGLSWGHLMSDFTSWQQWMRAKTTHDANDSWYAWWRAQMEFRNGASFVNKIIIFARECRIYLLAYCIAKASNWHWHTFVLGLFQSIGARLGGVMYLEEGLWHTVPVLAPVIIMSLLVLAMGASTHKRDHYPPLYKPHRVKSNNMTALVAAMVHSVLAIMTRLITYALVIFFIYLLLTSSLENALPFHTLIGGLLATFLTFYTTANLLAECFGVLRPPCVVNTVRLWHLVTGVGALTPMISWAALKYIVNSSELQMYYLLNSYGVRRSLLHMGHVNKMLKKIRRERTTHSYGGSKAEKSGNTDKRRDDGDYQGAADSSQHQDGSAIMDGRTNRMY